MIKLEFKNIEDLKQRHYQAVKSYVYNTMSSQMRLKLYQAITNLPQLSRIKFNDLRWLKNFILADIKTLKLWAADYSHCLQFDFMRVLYKNRFSNGADVYVDKEGSYNAYTLFRLMDIHVCPYCEHEYIEEVEISGVQRRTVEFDHFFPKGSGEFPGLAMCFYNLIPSCKQCNQLKLKNHLSVNPYEEDIETLTHLHPDLPVGILMEKVSVEECNIHLHATEGMRQNNRALALEERYKNVSHEVHRLLTNQQNYPEEKLEELERMGIDTKERLTYSLFGNPRKTAKGKELHTKMKEDLIGF